MLTSDAEDAEVKIVDFGFAATDVQGNNLLEQLGTPAYIAPEILNHQRYGKRNSVIVLSPTAYRLCRESGRYVVFWSYSVHSLGRLSPLPPC